LNNGNERFIEFFKDHNYGFGDDEKVWNTGREILAVDRIVHIYVIETSQTAICVEYKGKGNAIHTLVETFGTKKECLDRFYFLVNRLCADRKEIYF
jgi:hypothetical protein